MFARWLKSNAAVYFGNANTMRDFRVQLRGNRAIFLWGFYLLVLIGFAMIVYSQSAEGLDTSIVQAQYRLREFYQYIMILLAAMVNLIAPALTAGAIVVERQRRSLDLVFSAPVSPKYYLVGKMISSYRYVWMLLVLSLPVTAACVVLGGATWSDVISAYIILSINALIYTAIGLLFSTISKTPVSAVVWSYFAAAAYSFLSATMVSGFAFSSMMGRGTAEVPFVITLNPYFVVQAAPTYTDINGYHVPNWLLGGLAAVLISKLLLLGAASTMSSYGAAETKSFRLHGVIYMALIVALITFGLTASWGMIGGPSAGPAQPVMDAMFGWSLIFMVVLVPFLSCYGTDGVKRHWPDGTFSLRRLLLGTPSGGLPYTWLMILAAWAGFALVPSATVSTLPSVKILLWSICFWSFMWSLGRLSSSFNLGLRSARALHFTMIVALVALPIPFLSLEPLGDAGASPWDFYILRPLLEAINPDSQTEAWTAALAFLAVVVTIVAETNAARRSVMVRKA